MAHPQSHFLTSMPSSEGYALLEKHFPRGALAPTTVLIKAPQAPPEFVTGMITGALNESPGVAAAFPLGAADDGKLLAFQVIFEGDRATGNQYDKLPRYYVHGGLVGQTCGYGVRCKAGGPDSIGWCRWCCIGQSRAKRHHQHLLATSPVCCNRPATGENRIVEMRRQVEMAIAA